MKTNLTEIVEDMAIIPSITQEAIDGAKIFIKYLESLGKINLPVVEATEDAEISFWWSNKDNFLLDLGIFENGLCSYYAKLPRRDLFVDDVSPSTPLPDEIIRFLVVNE